MQIISAFFFSCPSDRVLKLRQFAEMFRGGDGMKKYFQYFSSLGSSYKQHARCVSFVADFYYPERKVLGIFFVFK